MTVLITDPDLEKRLKAERAETGGDRYDEVWEGITVMSALANNQHQSVAFQMSLGFHLALNRDTHAEIFAGVNVSDREDDWLFNFRCPDVAVFLPGCPAKDCGTHWFGGPDFGIEIVSPNDRSREKLDFYANVGVRELLIVDRDPWGLELFRLQKNRLKSVGRSDLARPEWLVSEVLPLAFRLIAGDLHPRIELADRDGKQIWLV